MDTWTKPKGCRMDAGRCRVVVGGGWRAEESGGWKMETTVLEQKLKKRIKKVYYTE